MFIIENFTPFKGAVLYDEKWPSFIQNINQLPLETSFNDICIIFGFNPINASKIVDNTIQHWRVSTETSFLHGISHLSLGKSPNPGNAIFIDLLWQTRFIEMAQKLKMISLFDVQLLDDKKTKTVNSYAAQKINHIIRSLYIYWWSVSQNKIKLPKLIYRGIRSYNLYGHETLRPAIDAIWATDSSHEMRRKKAVDLLIKWICNKKLHQLTDGNIFSFTSSIPTAKYFSNGEGIILCIDPTKVEIITSELHDPERLGGRDLVSNRMEKEYIVKIPENYNFVPENIIINDLEYFIAEENPLCVDMFDHDDKSATYYMHGLHISVQYYWKTNENGGLIFSTDGFHGNRKEFKQKYGFDPMPVEKNLSEISNFKFKKVEKRW